MEKKLVLDWYVCMSRVNMNNIWERGIIIGIVLKERLKKILPDNISLSLDGSGGFHELRLNVVAHKIALFLLSVSVGIRLRSSCKRYGKKWN